MNSTMSGLVNVALGILDNAQPTFNGGLITYIADGVDLAESSNTITAITRRIRKHVISTVTSKGYLWAIMCGAAWLLVLLMTALLLCWLQCRRKTSTSSVLRQQVKKKLRSAECEMCDKRCITWVQMSVFGIVLILCIIPLILAFVTNAQMNALLIASPDSQKKEALYPRVQSAMDNVITFLEQMTPRVRKDSVPIVDETIIRTLALANKTRQEYQKKFTEKLGVTRLLQLSFQIIVKITKTYNAYFNYTRNKVGISKLTYHQNLDITPNTIRRAFESVNETFGRLDKQCGPLFRLECDYLKDAIKEVRVITYTDVNQADPLSRIRNFGTSLITSMMEKNQSPKTIRKDYDDGVEKQKNTTRKLNKRFDSELNSTELILNLTAEKWDMMDNGLNELVQKLRNLSTPMIRTAPVKTGGFERSRNMIFLLLLLTLLIVLVFNTLTFTHVVVRKRSISGRQRNAHRCCDLLLFFFVAINVLLTSLLFLSSGYLQTELCRYLDEKPSVEALKKPEKFNSTLQLDLAVNKFINRNWNTIEQIINETSAKQNKTKSSIPMPKPRDLFYGLKTYCRQNKSIMLAIHGLESLDFAALRNDTPTLNFLQKGRNLLITELNKTDPNSNMKPTMKDDMLNLKQAAHMFIEHKLYPEARKRLKKPVVSINIDNFYKNWTDLKLRLESAGPNNDQLNTIKEADDRIGTVVRHIKNLEKIKNNAIDLLNILEKNSKVLHLINATIETIDQVKDNLVNKTKFINTALYFYDNIIWKKTLVNSGSIMKWSTKEIMKIIGPCHELYRAYEDVVAGVCYTIAHPLSALFFVFGWLLFLITPIFIGVLFLISKNENPENLAEKLPLDDGTVNANHEFTKDEKDTKNGGPQEKIALLESGAIPTGKHGEVANTKQDDAETVENKEDNVLV